MIVTPARLALLVLVLAVWPAAASGQSPQRNVQIDYYLNTAGEGVLVATPTPDAWGEPTWRECAPDGGECRFVGTVGQQMLRVGNPVAGTAYDATVTGNGMSITRRSDPWRGTLRVTRNPRVTGAVRVGSLVRPRPARWAGGWGFERPLLQLAACRSAKGRSCETLSETHYWAKCEGAGAVIPPRYQGWYLRVADQRYARNPVFPPGASYRRASAIPVRRAAANVAVAVVGRIGAPRGPRESNCDRSPSYLWPMARLDGHFERAGDRTVARVACPKRCRAVVTLSQGKRHVRFARTLPALRTRRARLVAPAERARSLRRGVPTRITVVIDGIRRAHGRITVG